MCLKFIIWYGYILDYCWGEGNSVYKPSVKGKGNTRPTEEETSFSYMYMSSSSFASVEISVHGLIS